MAEVIGLRRVRVIQRCFGRSASDVQIGADVANLFVMDASGFASSGWSNPTPTIMAFAVRSTDHLLERMRSGELY
jgi:hypothetical protein